MKKIYKLLILSACATIFFSNFADGEPSIKKNITIAAVGDVNFGSDYPGGKVPEEKSRHFFRNCEKILKSADISFCNLETVLCKKSFPAKKTDGKNTFIFKSPPEFAKILADAGFDVVSIANNHIRDFGIYGEDETKKALEKNNIQYVSRDGKIATFTIKGVKVWFVGFSSGYDKRSIMNHNIIFDEINELSEQCDILVVSFHAGAEGESALHTRNKTEFFLGENRGNVILLARHSIDNGADLVLIHGPHVPRAIEIYKDRFIAYSLGNFVNYGWNLKGSAKIAPLFWIELLPDGKFLQAGIYSFLQNKPGYPEFDRNNTAYKLIKKLTREDFGERTINFKEIQ